MPQVEKTEADAIGDTAGEPTVSAGSEPAESKPLDPDEALKLAIKAALDAGDLARVSALVEVLKATSMPTPASNVIDLDPERQRGRR